MFGQLLVAAVIAIASTLFLWSLWVTRFGASLPPHLPGFEPSASAFDAAAANASAGVTADAADAAMLLLERTDKLVKSYADSAAGLDAKANTILGFLGAGVGVLSVVNASGGPVPTLTPLLFVGLALVAAALIHSILVLWARVELELNLEAYVRIDRLKDKNAKAVLASQIAHSLLLLQRKAITPQLRKNSYVKGAQFSFAAGVVALMLNVVVPVASSPPKASTTCVVDVHPRLSVVCTPEVK